MRHYRDYLKPLLLAKEIYDLRVHPSWPLEVNGTLICKYEADFSYHETESNRLRVVDVKGVETMLFHLKAKLMWACWGIRIELLKVR